MRSDPASHHFCVWASGVPSDLRPLAWKVGAAPSPGGLGTSKAVCADGPHRVLRQRASPRGVGSTVWWEPFPARDPGQRSWGSGPAQAQGCSRDTRGFLEGALGFGIPPASWTP